MPGVAAFRQNAGCSVILIHLGRFERDLGNAAHFERIPPHSGELRLQFASPTGERCGATVRLRSLAFQALFFKRR
jgi:hypothetical protein